jgi:hypothetical protein
VICSIGRDTSLAYLNTSILHGSFFIFVNSNLVRAPNVYILSEYLTQSESAVMEITHRTASLNYIIINLLGIPLRALTIQS